MGNLTRDPELRTVGSKQTAVCDLGLAVNERRKSGNEYVEEATFVDVTLWGRTAEIAEQYLSKGSPVLIEGRLKLESWEKDGQKRSKLKVIGEEIRLLGGKPSEGEGERRQPSRDGGSRSGGSRGNDRPPTSEDGIPW